MLPSAITGLPAVGDIAPFLNLGAAGILVAGAWWFSRWWLRQIGSGEWVSRRELDNVRADRDARLAEARAETDRAWRVAGEYRAAHETSEHTRELLNQQNRDLIDALRAQNRLSDALHGLIERGSDDEHPPVGA